MKYNIEDIEVSNEYQKEYYLDFIEVVNNKINNYEEKMSLIKNKNLYNDKGHNEPRGFILFNIDKIGD